MCHAKEEEKSKPACRQCKEGQRSGLDLNLGRVLLVHQTLYVPNTVQAQDLSSTESSDDPSFDPSEELKTNPMLRLEQYVEEWALTLDRDDKVSLGLFLAYNIESTLLPLILVSMLL